MLPKLASKHCFPQIQLQQTEFARMDALKTPIPGFAMDGKSLFEKRQGQARLTRSGIKTCKITKRTALVFPCAQLSLER